MTAAPLVSLDGVDKVYPNGAVALRGFTLAVKQPEFVAVLGPSGCGKSTMLRLIAGLAAPSAGAVNHADRAAAVGAASPAPFGRGIGFVFQEPTLMPWATVFDNVWLPLRLAGISRAEAKQRVEAALAQVHLDGCASAYPRELSGGMKMRVSIARALITRPALLLMDEPFGALDEITRLRLIDELLALWRGQPWTVVFVTHSVYESVYLAQRIVVMTPQPGRVFAEIAIPEPYPRSEEFRATPLYLDCCRQVSAQLRQAMAGGGPVNVGPVSV